MLPLQSPGITADEFAGLPRIRPFTDFELDPVEPPLPAYTGRRRRPEDDDGERGAGRHSRPADEPERRHRRAEDNADDLLARLLAREGH